MIKRFNKYFCKHEDRYAYRKYGDFEFTEFLVCTNCNTIINILKGFDEDLRG